MKNNDPLHTLQLKLSLVAQGQQISLSPEEAELYGTKQADILTEELQEDHKDGQ